MELVIFQKIVWLTKMAIYGAYKENINDKNDAHITGWFKTKDEIQKFVNEHREYGKEM